MTLWLILVVMTAGALFAVLWPLTRQAPSVRPGGTDAAVYRDQLDELERDRAAGLIGAAEAEAARVEISRRLLAAVDASPARSTDLRPAAATQRRRVALISSLLAIPVVAFGLYLWLGSPELAAQSMVVSGQDSIEKLVARAEAHLQHDPEDGYGWEVLAPVYMRLDRYSDSVEAWSKALQLLGESAERDANLGEALTAEADGVVTAAAKNAFVRATTLDKTNVSARYYLGLAAEQDGERDKAAQIWRELIAQAPAGAFWVGEVRSALARVEGNPTAAVTPAPAPAGAAATNKPPVQEQAMIHSMVDRLAARLQQDGSDVDGWVRLIRSYKVLGDPDKENAAVASAKQALTGDPDKLQKLDAGLKELNAADAGAPAVANSEGARTAISGAPPEHQQGAMLATMVDRLASRLKASGSDPDGWLMLVRSYVTLRQQDKASAAIGDARQALAYDPDKLQHFNEALNNFKIGQ